MGSSNVATSRGVSDGQLPESMLAQTVRQDRFGRPADAFRLEEVPTPTPGPGEVLLQVMAAGINYNNVWAARGVPIDVIAVRQRAGEAEDFHIGGSDASGVVRALGPGVQGVEVGQPVVAHPGWWKEDDPWVQAGKDPMVAPSARIWGYETNYGAFGQYAICQAHQLMPKAQHLTWEEAAAPSLVGTTAFRMLFGWEGHELEKGDVVLIWGGSGGLGSQAIQLAKHVDAIPVAVVSSAERGRYCESIGAAGYINRNDFDHWGVPPRWDDGEGQKQWTAGARAFGKRIWEIVGDRRNPRIVFEHPGEATVPTSIFLCEPGGMVVICAGTSGYTAVVDLRYHWVRQKRFQGSHGTNDAQAHAYNRLIGSGVIDPCLGQTFSLEELPKAHQLMADGELAPGNAAVLIGAAEPGMGASDGSVVT